MKHLILFALLLSACVPLAVPPANTATPIPPTVAPPPTETLVPPPAPTNVPPPAPTSEYQLGNDGMTVAYDFAAHLCEAVWMTGTQKNLPCPGDLNYPGNGYVGLLSGSDQGLDANLPMIMMFPDGAGSSAYFGRFPKFTVGPNDEFRATLACRKGADCYVSFTLGYYDSRGKYQEPWPMEYYRYGVEPPINRIWPLRELAGQTVEFVLAVRGKQNPTENWALWIAPRILRP